MTSSVQMVTVGMLPKFRSAPYERRGRSRWRRTGRRGRRRPGPPSLRVGDQHGVDVVERLPVLRDPGVHDRRALGVADHLGVLARAGPRWSRIRRFSSFTPSRTLAAVQLRRVADPLAHVAGEDRRVGSLNPPTTIVYVPPHGAASACGASDRAPQSPPAAPGQRPVFASSSSCVPPRSATPHIRTLRSRNTRVYNYPAVSAETCTRVACQSGEPAVAEHAVVDRGAVVQGCVGVEQTVPRRRRCGAPERDGEHRIGSPTGRWGRAPPPPWGRRPRRVARDPP